MHAYTAECIHSHMPTGKTDRDKQSSSTWIDPLVNDIQNQEVNLSATWHWHWGHRWNEVQATKGKQKCLIMTYLVQAEAHAFLLYRENEFMPIQDDLCLKTRMHNTVSSGLPYLMPYITGRHCHSHLLSDRCCAGNPLCQAPACYKWADALRDMVRLKISPSHLMLAPRTGKCVWRPLVLFLYLPVTHTAAAQAEPARHAVWLWRAAFNTLNVRGFTQMHRTCREKHFNLFFLFVLMSGYTHQHTGILLYNLQAHTQIWPWTWKGP